MTATLERGRALRWGPWLTLFLIALLVRWPVWTGPFDREFDGFQGGFFATTTVNYERLGLDAADGYPIANVELDPERPDTWYVYPNHPPTVPWMAWGSARLFGPEGWREAWRDNRAPTGLEPSLRFPFGLAQIATALGLVAFLACAGRGLAAALCGVAFAFAPIEVGYAGLVNYEHPAMAAAVWTGVAVAAWCRSPGPWRVAGCALGAGAGTAVTFTPAFFLPGFALLALAHRGRAAWKPILGLGLGALLPILLHRHFGGRVLAEFELSPDPLFDRVQRLLAPLLDGSLPFDRWLGIQVHSGLAYLGPELCLLGSTGLLLAAVSCARSSREARLPAGMALALFAGGALAHVAFYKHTGDPQPSFLLNLAPGLAAGAGLALAAIVERLWPRRSALAALAPATILAIVGGLRSDALIAPWRAPSSDQPGSPALDLPRGRGAPHAQRVPAGPVAWYTASRGRTPPTFFHAWRTMLPVVPTDASYAAAQGQLERFDQGNLPLVLALPKRPPAKAASETTALAERLAADYPELFAAPLVDDGLWTVFRLR